MALGSTTCECVKELGVNLNKWNNIEINDNYNDDGFICNVFKKDLTKKVKINIT